MLGARLDRLLEKHPLLARYAERRIFYFFHTSTTANILACTAATFAAGIFALRNDIIYYIAIAIMCVMWIEAAFLSGFLKQWLFPLFSAAFWGLPSVFIDAVENAAEADKITPLDEFLAYLSHLIFDSLRISETIGTDTLTVSIIFAGWSVLIFLLGVYTRPRAKHSIFYCKTRLNHIQ